ncbi:MAG: PEP-CTERM sorting domain-containing protein [Pseudomonadales bacterium]|nr:PEP-CTERM sorting domain-containing protein [Pseudomonadales bacterium]
MQFNNAIRSVYQRAGLVAGFFMVTVSPAQADVIDFEAFVSAGTGVNSYISPFDVDGYRFTGNFNFNDYLIFETSHSEFAGSTALTPFSSETHTFSRIDGQNFDLYSFDYAELLVSAGAGSVDFVGNFALGGSITQNVTSDGILGFESASFAGFTGLSSVVFTYGTASAGDGFQLDNIHVATSVAVPEPTSTALLVLGLIGVASRRLKAG